MIHHPFLIIIFLLSVEAVILYFSGHRRFKRYFSFLPAVFWIYFLPMLASSVGVIDSRNQVYPLIISNLLPASLLLLLLGVDIQAILKLGKKALMMFFAGSLGIILGAPAVFFLFKKLVGNNFWSGFGALSASWTGGSANMVAVKEALGVPDSVFLPMVVVDTIVPYVWMGFLVAASGLQAAFDKWNNSDRKILIELNNKTAGIESQEKNIFSLSRIVIILGLTVAGSFFCQFLARRLPEIKDVISTYAWTIILVSCLGIWLSLTPLRRLERYGTTKIGYFLLYFVLTSIGARASLTNIGSTFILIVAGFLLVIFHAGILLLTARLIKAPMFLVAVASQANIGGVASAPVVAEIYQPGLASVGLLLAILGNIVGTYFGIIAGQLCRFLASGY